MPGRPILQRKLVATLLISLGLMLLPGQGRAQRGNDSAEVVATVRAFHQALGRGDSAAALALLAPDAVILEAGGIENREEYRAHHLAADIGFARAIPSVTGPLRVVAQKDVAWASSTSRASGTFEGRSIDSQGAELVVLSRSPRGWLIRAIHWSSRSKRGRARRNACRSSLALRAPQGGSDAARRGPGALGRVRFG